MNIFRYKYKFMNFDNCVYSKNCFRALCSQSCHPQLFSPDKHGSEFSINLLLVGFNKNGVRYYHLDICLLLISVLSFYMHPCCSVN